MSNQQDIYRRFFAQCREVFPVSMHPWNLDAMTQGNWAAVIMKKGTDVQAVWPYYLKKKYGIAYVTMPVLTKWMGPVFSPKIGQQKRTGIIREMIKQFPSLSYQDQNFPYENVDWSPFEWAGLSQSIKYSFRIDLEQETSLIKNGMIKQYQKMIDQFPREAFTIFQDKDVSSFYQKSQQIFNQQDLKIPYSFEQLSSQFTAAVENEQGALFSIKDGDEQIHSSVFLLWDDTSCYTHIIVDDKEKRSSNASFYLIWHLIMYAKQNLQKRHFDFEGSMIKGVQEVRKNFGAQPIAYHRGYRYRNRFVKLGHSFVSG